MGKRRYPILSFLDGVVDFLMYMAQEFPKEMAKIDEGFGLVLEIILAIFVLMPGFVLKLVFSLIRTLLDKRF